MRTSILILVTLLGVGTAFLTPYKISKGEVFLCSLNILFEDTHVWPEEKKLIDCMIDVIWAVNIRHLVLQTLLEIFFRFWL